MLPVAFRSSSAPRPPRIVINSAVRFLPNDETLGACAPKPVLPGKALRMAGLLEGPAALLVRVFWGATHTHTGRYAAMLPPFAFCSDPCYVDMHGFVRPRFGRR